MKYFCCEDERRRNAVKELTSPVNGIDFLEVDDDQADPPSARQRFLFVHFVKGLNPGQLKINNVLIEGGERVKDIEVVDVKCGAVGPAPYNDARVMVVEVKAAGDFSTYTLRLVEDAARARAQGAEVQDSAFRKTPEGFDPILSSVDFSFKILCESDFDCQPARVCPPEELAQPDINYLAKDYASFRQLMLDRMAAIMPNWRERNPADLGIALVELLAYVGDYLSYQQDAVSTEAYLRTARRRASVRRHARLVDYLMSDGSNARAWIHVRAQNGVSNLWLRSYREREALSWSGQTKVFTKFLTRVTSLPKTLNLSSQTYKQALVARPQVFEPLHDLPLYAEHNELRFWTWGARECCLPLGATSATLRGHYPNLKPGHVLILTEALGPATGQRADADPSHRQAVRLQKVSLSQDPIGGQFTTPASGNPLPVTEIEWHEEDALAFPLCVSSREDTNYFEDVSVALGNIVLADHGLTIADEALPEVPGANMALTKVAEAAASRCNPEEPELTLVRYRPLLRSGPLTQAAPFIFDDSSISARAALKWEMRRVLPEISIAEDGVDERWRPVRDLLNSSASQREFVVETETDGTATLRFGDDRFGSRPAASASLTATYRVGNGQSGNVGADTLLHLASNDPALIANVEAIRNPLAARGGTEPETNERVRQDAPSAFRTQERAVTMDDYAEKAQGRCDLGVQRAAATLRWTGSWRTVFVTADRLAGRAVDEKFEKDLRLCLERYRMAGHDLEVDAPRFVSLEVEMAVCVKRGYLTSDVKQALLEVFSNRVSTDGRRGLFHPDNFSFGQPVYLSRLFAAAQATPGVDSVEITKFQRQGINSNEALVNGQLNLGRLEIARLDNNPDFSERGVFRLTMKGGQ
jgi:Baseplate J-like protein